MKKTLLLMTMAAMLQADLMCEHAKKSFEQNGKKIQLQIKHNAHIVQTCSTARMLKSDAIDVLTYCTLEEEMAKVPENIIKEVDKLKCD